MKLGQRAKFYDLFTTTLARSLQDKSWAGLKKGNIVPTIENTNKIIRAVIIASSMDLYLQDLLERACVVLPETTEGENNA